MLYVAVALSSFRRYSTYTAATLAGIFTNSVFGVIISFSYIALWKENPTAGGYDVTDALTYCWLAQAMIMTVAIWSGGTTDDVAERIRTGDVAIDLYRPVSFLGWFLAGDLGRAAYHLLTRGIAPTIVGALLFDLRFPTGPLTYLAFLVSVTLGVVVSFAIRMLVASSAFWLLDQSGVLTLSSVFAMFFSRARACRWCCSPSRSAASCWRCPGRRSSRCRSTSGSASAQGAGVLGGLAFQAGWGAVLLLGVRRPCSGSPTAGWWSRVAEPARAASRGTCARSRSWPAMWIRGRLDLPHVVPGADRRVLRHHRRRLRRDRDHVRQRRRPRRLRARADRLPVRRDVGSASASRTCVVGNVERLGRRIRHGHVRRDDGPAGRGASRRCAPTSSRCAGSAGSRRAPRCSAWSLTRRRRSTGPRPGSRCWCRCWSAARDLPGPVRARRDVPVRQQRRLRGRQRVHLRRQHDDAVPADDLPGRGGQGADLPGPGRVRELVPRPVHPRRPRPVRAARPAAASPRRSRPLVLCLLAALAWRSGVRHYRSTGS